MSMHGDLGQVHALCEHCVGTACTVSQVPMQRKQAKEERRKPSEYVTPLHVWRCHKVLCIPAG